MFGAGGRRQIFLDVGGWIRTLFGLLGCCWMWRCLVLFVVYVSWALLQHTYPILMDVGGRFSGSYKLSSDIAGCCWIVVVVVGRCFSLIPVVRCCRT